MKEGQTYAQHRQQLQKEKLEDLGDDEVFSKPYNQQPGEPDLKPFSMNMGNEDKLTFFKSY